MPIPQRPKPYVSSRPPPFPGLLQVIVVERGDLVFVFNFHPTNSYTDYRVGCRDEGPFKVGGREGGAGTRGGMPLQYGVCVCVCVCWGEGCRDEGGGGPGEMSQGPIC